MGPSLLPILNFQEWFPSSLLEQQSRGGALKVTPEAARRHGISFLVHPWGPEEVGGVTTQHPLLVGS